MLVISDSSTVLSHMGESLQLFTLAAFKCKDYWQTRRKQ